jgi:light-regulated signal transduction histidine kinase (bacteriophytochrome)
MSVDWDEHMARLLHDMRSLVRRAATRTQLLERRLKGGADQEADGLIQEIIEANRDLERFLGRVAVLNDAARPESQPRLPLSAVVLSATMQLKQALAEAKGAVETGPMPEVMVPNKIHQVLVEVISNSIRFRDDARPLMVEIGARHETPNLILQVEDNGQGWEAEFGSRVFAPFEKLDARKGGFGLGLAIARAIVERAGGAISGTPLTEGASFEIVIPV